MNIRTLCGNSLKLLDGIAKFAFQAFINESGRKPSFQGTYSFRQWARVRLGILTLEGQPSYSTGNSVGRWRGGGCPSRAKSRGLDSSMDPIYRIINSCGVGGTKNVFTRPHCLHAQCLALSQTQSATLHLGASLVHVLHKRV